jgi:putative exporter of polyketide antibiotics
VRWLSPFDHLAAVPVERAYRPGAVGLLTDTVLLAVLGAAGYRRRDLRA